MIHATIKVLIGMLVILVGMSCERILGPTEFTDSLDSKLEAVSLSVLPVIDYPPPTGEVTVEYGGQSLTFWPFTGEDFTGHPQDPINLIFCGKADPRDIRAALLSLDGNRTAYGFPDAPPWNCRWNDAIGNVQVSYGQSEGWTGGVVQLACGEYGPIRFHVRLFKVGQWTVGNAHFELLIPGTADHQVLSWEKAEQLVLADMDRCGLLGGIGFSQYIDQEPFRTIPAVIYNEVPVELRAYIEGPLDDVTEDVPIPTDGIIPVFNLAGQAPRVPEVRVEDFTIEYDLAMPKPFCALSPYDFVYVQGPVHLYQTAELKADGEFSVTFRAAGELTVTPIDINTGQPIGQPLTAVIKEHHDALMTDQVYAASALLSQKICPSSDPNAGALLKRLHVSSNGLEGFQVLLHCPEDDDFVDVTGQTPCQVDLTGSSAEK